MTPTPHITVGYIGDKVLSMSPPPSDWDVIWSWVCFVLVFYSLAGVGMWLLFRPWVRDLNRREGEFRERRRDRC